MKRALSGIVMAAALLSGAVYAQDEPVAYFELGPLMVRSQSPAQALRLVPMPSYPRRLKPGYNEIQASYTVSSIWARESGLYFLDFQMADTRIGLLHGLHNGWSVEWAINQRQTLNAHLDGITLAFHNAFGIDQNGRDKVPKNDIRIQIPPYGIDLDRSDAGVFTRGVELTANKLLYRGTRSLPAFSTSFTMRYETHDGATSNRGEIDTSAQFAVSKKFGADHAYANFTYTHFGSDHFMTVPLRSNQFSGMLAYELSTAPNRAFLVQYLYSQGVVPELGELSKPSHEIHLGYKWRFERSVAQLGLIENIINLNNSPDFGLTFGLNYRL